MSGKPRVGDLVRIDRRYPNTEAAGKLALVVKTLAIKCIVQPIGPGLSVSQLRHDKPWWFSPEDLEVISETR